MVSVVLLLFLCAVNRLTVESTAYYYVESSKQDSHNHVQLSQAPGAPVFAELQLEGGDGTRAAEGEAAAPILCIHSMPWRRGQSYGFY